MICKNCGQEITNNVKFCPKCGSRTMEEPGVIESGSRITIEPGVVESGNDQRKMKKDKIKIPKDKKKLSKGKKALTALIILFVLVVAISITVVVYYMKCPAKQIVDSFNEGDCKSVIRIYNNEVEDNFIQQFLLKKLIGNKVPEIIEGFKKETISYDEAKIRLETLQQLNIETLKADIESALPLLEELNASANAYEKAEQHYENGNYTEAMQEYALVIESDDHYREAQTKITECVANYKAEIMRHTENLASEEDYKNAMSVLEVALSVLPDDEELSDTYESVKNGYADMLKQDTLKKSVTYLENNQYGELFDLIDKALEINSTDTELKNLQETAIASFEKYVQTEIDNYIKNGKYNDAIQFVTDAQNILPENEFVKKLLEETKNKKPVALSELKITESSQIEKIESNVVTEDSIGNVYSPGNLFVMWARSDNAYATVYLNKKYTQLKGMIAVADTSDQGTSVKFAVYGDDGKLLYASEDLSKTTAPFNVSVDVRDVEWLTISCERMEGYDAGILLISDFVFTNN